MFEQPPKPVAEQIPAVVGKDVASTARVSPPPSLLHPLKDLMSLPPKQDNTAGEQQHTTETMGSKCHIPFHDH